MYFGMTIVRCIFLQGLILLCRFQLKGAALSINLTEGLWHGTDFKCNSTVTLRCYVTPNSFLVQWKVGNPIGPHSDSDCYKFGCGISKTFPGRYTYSFDASSGVSDLKIVNVNVTDDNMTYQCNNASSTAEFKASVKVPPSSSATVNETKHFQNETEFKVTTSCIYPANLTKFSWHSSKIDGTIRREYSATTQNSTLCQALTNMCVVANKSEYVSSVLILPNLQTGQTGIQTIIKVEVIYDDKPLFNSTVGTYMDKAAVSEIPCSVDENCTATNSKCEILDAKCNCMPGYREDDTDGATCIIVLGSSCSTDNWNAVCIVDNSICGANSECECKAGYINSGVFCLKDTSSTSTTTTTTTTTTKTTETTEPSSNQSSIITIQPVPGTTQNLNESDSITLFFKKYKFEAIAIGCSLIVIIVAAMCGIIVFKRKVKNRKKQNTGRAMRLSNINT